MRQIQFLELTDDVAINIISSDNQQYLRIEYYKPEGIYVVDRASRNYQNARMLSEGLRDAIGYGPAIDLLRKHNVPEDDPLMYLGKN